MVKAYLCRCWNLAVLYVSIHAVSQAAGETRIVGGPENGVGSLTYEVNWNQDITARGSMGVGNVSIRGTALGYEWNPIRLDAETGTWQLLQRPVPTQHSYVHAFSINDAGTVVGVYGGRDGRFAVVRWDAGSTTPTLLEGLGTDTEGHSMAWGTLVNDSGTVFGIADAYTDGGEFLGRHAVRWAPGTVTPTPLERLSNLPREWDIVQLHAANPAGDLVGYTSKMNNGGNSFGYRAVRWRGNSTEVEELAVLGDDGTSSTNANDINDTGVVVGDAWLRDPATGIDSLRAVRWLDSNTIEELENVPMTPGGTVWSIAAKVNTLGIVVGNQAEQRADSPGGFVNRVVRWNPDGTQGVLLEMPFVDATDNDEAVVLDLNDASVSVGYLEQYSDDYSSISRHAILWQPEGEAVLLDALLPQNSGWVHLIEAWSISEEGWIAGVGEYDPDGIDVGQAAYRRLFMMQVPEPVNALFLLLIAARRRR